MSNVDEEKRKEIWKQILKKAKYEDKEVILIDRSSLYFIIGDLTEN